MFDIGIGEILIMAVVGLLIFGPDRLPKAAADAAKWLKQIRGMASGARQDLADSAGIDFGETVDTIKSLQEFHPRRLAAGLFEEDAAKPKQPVVPDAEQAPGGSASPAAPPRPAFDPDAT
jgi:sec-independent protein translocase protein TatB